MRDGSIVDTAAVTGLAAVVNAADSPDLVFRAVNADGRVLASARIPTAMPGPPEAVGWW